MADPITKNRYPELAMMVVEGIAPSEIATRMSVEAAVVKRFIGCDAPKGFKAVLKEYRLKLMNTAVERRYRFIEMADKSYRNIDEALDCDDLRLKTETAWKVLDEVAPKPEKADVEINVTQNNMVNSQILDATKGIFDLFTELKKQEPTSFAKHLKHGAEALPTAYRNAMENQIDLSADTVDAEIVDAIEGEPVDPAA